MLRAGTLDKRVTIQSPATGQDNYGEPLTGWADVAVNIAASIQDLNGREYLAAAATQNAVTSKITIRHTEGVQPAMRVLHGSVAYNIEAVLGTDRVKLLLMCSRGVNNG